MKRISKDFISSCPQESETYVDNIRKLKNDYQYVIKDMVDMYRNVLKKPEALDDWTKEVDDIGNAVKKHVDMIKPKLYHYLPLCQQYLGMSGHGHTVVFHHLKGKRQSSQLVRRLVVLLGLRTFYQLQGRTVLPAKTIIGVKYELVSETDNGHKPVRAVDHQPVSEADHVHKPVRA